MQAFVIVLMGNARSVKSWQQCCASSVAVGNLFAPAVWHGVRAEDAQKLMDGLQLRWTYPLEGIKEIGGLQCSAYRGHHLPRVACALAHFQLWEFCADGSELFLVQEDDSLWTRRFDPAPFEQSKFGMISLNSPAGATRRAFEYSSKLRAATGPIVEVPQIDEMKIPQGHPGHSAYFLHPWFAAKLVAKVRELGLMPNDAIANRSWFPGELGASTTFYTTLNGRTSLIR